MQYIDGIKLRKNWKGGDCKHPHLSKEYTLGKSTEDWICTTCGEEFSKEERDSLKKDL